MTQENTYRLAQFSLPLLLICTVAIFGHSQVFAQQTGAAFNGLSASSNSPIEIEADELIVQDGEKTAIFRGNVKLVQGPVTLRASSIKVFYAGKASGASQSISKVEARGPIRVVNRDQKARGDNAVYIMKSKLLTLNGNVVLNQGKNEIRGSKLTVNLQTGVADMKSSGRVRGVFAPAKN